MNEIIKNQLTSIRNIVVYKVIQKDPLEASIGKVINEYRTYIINSLTNENKSIMTNFAIPITINENDININASIALILIDQLLPLIKYQKAEYTLLETLGNVSNDHS